MTTGQLSTPRKIDSQSQLSSATFIRFLKGGLSGVVSGALLQPLNVIKTSMQVAPIDKVSGIKKEKLTFTEATKTIYKNEGSAGFLRGFTPSIVKCFTTSGTFFSTLYFFEENIKRL